MFRHDSKHAEAARLARRAAKLERLETEFEERGLLSEAARVSFTRHALQQRSLALLGYTAPSVDPVWDPAEHMAPLPVARVAVTL